jgi:hypothetical protein
MQQFCWFELGKDIWTYILDLCSICDEVSARKTCKFLYLCSTRDFVKRRAPSVLGRNSESEEDDLKLIQTWYPFCKYFSWKTFTTEIEDQTILDCYDFHNCLSGNVLVTHSRSSYTDESMFVASSLLRSRSIPIPQRLTFQEGSFEIHSYDAPDHSMRQYDPLFFNDVRKLNLRADTTAKLPCLADVLELAMVSAVPDVYFLFTTSDSVIQIRIPITDYSVMCKAYIAFNKNVL